MKRIKMATMLYSPFLIKELFFGAQVFLMVVLLMVVIVPVTNVISEYDQMERLYGQDIDRLIYYTQIDTGIGQTETKDLDIRFASWLESGCLEKTYRNQMVRAKMGEDTEQITMLIYSEQLFLDTEFQLIGRLPAFDLTTESWGLNEEAYPMIISEDLAVDYPPGSEMLLKMDCNRCKEEHSEIRGLVVGILKRDSMISYIGKGGGNYDYLGRLGVNTLAFGREKMVIGVYDERYFHKEDWNGAAVFSVAESVDRKELLAQMNAEVGVEGRIVGTDDLYRNSMDKVIQDAEAERLLVILFAVVFVVDFWGYILMSIRKKGHLYAILFMCGWSKREALIVNLVSVVMIVFPAVCLGLYMAPLASEFILREGFQGYTWHIYPIICGLFLMTMLCGVLTAFARQRNLNVVTQYREGI
ncbi:MAG: hypothetical protein IJZ85_04105 [Lachnospiraceae bacterium]|nr:hypothetical protein [Lachnospiraceae bacterium]